MSPPSRDLPIPSLVTGTAASPLADTLSRLRERVGVRAASSCAAGFAAIRFGLRSLPSLARGRGHRRKAPAGCVDARVTRETASRRHRRAASLRSSLVPSMSTNPTASSTGITAIPMRWLCVSQVSQPTSSGPRKDVALSESS